jgi:formyltetrahydrofolate deformylase
MASVLATLLVSCPDQPGIVAAQSDFVFRHGGNILDFDQHTDLEDGTYLSRVSWDLSGFTVPREAIAEAFRPVADRFRMHWQLRFSDEVERMAIFVSKLDHCLHDLLWRCRVGELRANLACVVSNHPDLGPVASSYGVPFHVHPMTRATKEAEERRVLQRLRDAEST